MSCRTGADSSSWHGKVVQWHTATSETWELTGSPNLSRPALLGERVGEGGNCELAVLSRIYHDLTPSKATRRRWADVAGETQRRP